MKKITLLDITYEIKENNKDAVDEDVLKEAFTDYFTTFDLIVGDWAYGKLRLKGFNKKGNPNYREINAEKNIKDYITNYCAYDCRYFILEKEPTIASVKK